MFYCHAYVCIYVADIGSFNSYNIVTEQNVSEFARQRDLIKWRINNGGICFGV